MEHWTRKATLGGAAVLTVPNVAMAASGTTMSPAGPWGYYGKTESY